MAKSNLINFLLSIFSTFSYVTRVCNKFKNNDEFQFHEKLLDKFISSNHHKSVSICLQNKISTETAETKQSGIGELIISYWLIRERRTTDRILIGGLKLERDI